MTGYQNIIVRGLGTSSVLLPCAILLGYAAVFCAVAIWLFIQAWVNHQYFCSAKGLSFFRLQM